MTKTFVLAPDSFKESLTALEACLAMQRGILQVYPEAICVTVPMADGGEGTVDALISSMQGKQVSCVVQGPLVGQDIHTYFGLVDEGRTAVIEMAKANGIHLLTALERNPMLTSTYGTGQMIKCALDLGVHKMIIGLGGSVTNDGGAGMAQALGVKFLDQYQQEIEVCGGCLNQICSIDISALDQRLAQTEIIIASDVNNPLCGSHGASYIFAPQKGATPQMVEALDNNLKDYAALVEQTLNIDVQHQAGAGAAGGLGFGLLAFANAKIQSGIELMIQHTSLVEKIAQADVVLTGEGRIDAQTLLGKTPFGVAQVAKQFAKPVFAFAGIVGEGIEPLFDAGFSQIVGINPPNVLMEDAIKNAKHYLEKSVFESFQKYQID